MIDRRSFLKQLAGAAVLAAAPFPAFAALPSMKSALHSETRLMMGTFVTVTTHGLSEAHAAEAVTGAYSAMARAEALLTRFDSASALGQLNASGGLRDLPVEVIDVIHAASHIHKCSGGAFDPTVLPMVEAMEKGAGLAEARALVGMGHVRVEGSSVRFDREGVKMSLDGIAKGYIADLGAKHLLRAGVKDFLINAGGDIVAHGSKAGKPWKVAVENPGKYEGETAYPAVCALKGQAMATSGNYESAARGFSHLVDPLGHKGIRPVSATVVAPTAMEADALATALCVMAEPMAFIERMPHTACCLIMPDGSVHRSSRWA
ncbi:FAD:protein FMN transferase [Mailhella sp.]